MTTVAEHQLFDGDDVDLGEVAPEGDEMGNDELAVIEAAVAIPNSPKPGIGAS